MLASLLRDHHATVAGPYHLVRYPVQFIAQYQGDPIRGVAVQVGQLLGLKGLLNSEDLVALGL